MRAVVQRVSRAQVSVGEEVAGEIGPGLLVLLGVAKSDTKADAEYLAAKITGLRIFEDENGTRESIQESREWVSEAISEWMAQPLEIMEGRVIASKTK